MTRTALALALGVGLMTAAVTTVASAGQRSPESVLATIDDTRTTLTVEDGAAAGHILVALPPGASDCDVRVTGGAGEATVGGVMRLRGLPVASIVTRDLSAGAVLDVSHDGSWAAKAGDSVRAFSRGFDGALAGLLSGLPTVAASAGDGAYLVITTPEYADACAPLLAWKQEKGFPVRLATTTETGTDNAGIRTWLREAYATWTVPPEYVLIVGDVEDIPSWSLSENVTDHPYTLMDEDDWLPDLMLGRLPVESVYEATTVINKTVGYEKTPYRVDEGWLTRQLMVAGNYGSDTPVSTVTWVGEQLEDLGFDAATHVSFPPLFNGVFPITQSLEEGVSMVVYRGWAYGTAGWEPPHFTVADIPKVANGAMTPVVMSFVCLNGNFADDDPCFGEVFLRQGTPTEPRGAVAFIGNGEHWSHTRYNDAMAISYFENIASPGITDLGRLVLAGKLRFMDYFPHEMSFAEHGEESVEFYLHIYNLLGDPELNFWRGETADLTVSHDATCAPEATRFDVTVTEADGTTPLVDARVGIVQDGVLIGAVFSGDDGVAHVPLVGLADTAPVTVTVTHSDRFPYQADVTVVQPAAHLVVSGLTWINNLGNDDQVINPAEVINVFPEVTNTGTSAATGITMTLSMEAPANVQLGTITLPDIPADGIYQATGDEFFRFGLLTQVSDGTELHLFFDAVHAAGTDHSEEMLTVGGPTITVAGLAVGGDGFLRQGQDNEITLSVTNNGGLPLVNPHAHLNLVTLGVGTLVTEDVTLADVAPGATVTADAAFVLNLDGDVPTGRGVVLHFVISDDGEWYQASLNRELIVGDVDAGAPIGPDAYGYYAIDSADIDYPASVPEYRWTHLDPALGGDGVEIVFATDNAFVQTDLPFAFQYYGQTHTGQIRVSENGWISFDNSDELEFYNWPLPNTHGNHSVIAPFWDNFDPTLEGTGGVFTYYDAAAGTFTVEWSRMVHYLSALEDADPPIDDIQTFQVVLFDPAVHVTATGDGEILFLYRQVVNADHLRQFATVGQENASETDGLELTYAGIYAPGMAPIGPGLAVKLTTDAPVYSPYAVKSFALARVGADVELTWHVDNARPLTGWSVVRVDAEGETDLGDGPLPADARDFLDPDAPADAVYRLYSLHPYGHRNLAGSADLATATGSEGLVRFVLHPAQPNPTRGDAHIAFTLGNGGPATLRVYDVAGRLVRTLLDDERPAGPTSLTWDGRDHRGQEAAAGVYFMRLESAGDARTQKLLLVR